MAKRESIWFEYDWRFDGDSARFGVNMSLYSMNPAEIDREAECTLMTLIFSSPKDNSLTDTDFSKLMGFVHKCIESLNKAGRSSVHDAKVCVAGFIRTAKLLRFYIYIDPEQYPVLSEELFRKQKRFTGSIEKKTEQGFATYNQLLRPDVAKLQTVRNAETLEMLRKNGDTTAPRRMNLHLAFKNEPTMLMFNDAALKEGFAIGIQEPRDTEELPCGIVLRRICAMKKRDVDNVTTNVIRLADKFGGQLLYWDCPIMASLKKKGSLFRD